jgi:hypothetical protein
MNMQFNMKKKKLAIVGRFWVYLLCHLQLLNFMAQFLSGIDHWNRYWFSNIPAEKEK